MLFYMEVAISHYDNDYYDKLFKNYTVDLYSALL